MTEPASTPAETRAPGPHGPGGRALPALGWRTLGWRALALVALGLGVVGVALPGVPTVPFLLLAAWAAGHGWPAFERWLLDHPRLGPPVRDWRERGAVSRRAKRVASASMALGVLAAAAGGMPRLAVVALGATLLAVAAWLWRRPER